MIAFVCVAAVVVHDRAGLETLVLELNLFVSFREYTL